MTVAGLDGHWETTAPPMQSSCNDSVIQLSPLSSYAVLEVVEISHACFVHLVLQYSPHTLVNWIKMRRIWTLEARGRMNTGVSLLAKTAFSTTSQLRHHNVVSCKYWWNILQFFSHTDCQDDWCQKLLKKLSKFVKSYGQNTVGPFFAGHGVYMVGSRRIVQWRTQATGELTTGAPRTSINNANISHVSAWVAKFLMLIVRVINYCSRIRILRFFFKIKNAFLRFLEMTCQKT